MDTESPWTLHWLLQKHVLLNTAFPLLYILLYETLTIDKICRQNIKKKDQGTRLWDCRRRTQRRRRQRRRGGRTLANCKIMSQLIYLCFSCSIEQITNKQQCNKNNEGKLANYTSVGYYIDIVIVNIFEVINCSFHRVYTKQKELSNENCFSLSFPFLRDNSLPSVRLVSNSSFKSHRPPRGPAPMPYQPYHQPPPMQNMYMNWPRGMPWKWQEMEKQRQAWMDEQNKKSEEAQKRGEPYQIPNYFPPQKEPTMWEKLMQEKWSEIMQWCQEHKVFVPPELQDLFGHIIYLGESGDYKQLSELLTKKWEEFKKKIEGEPKAGVRGYPNQHPPSIDEHMLQMWKYSLAGELERLVMIGKRFGLDFEDEIKVLKDKAIKGKEEDLRDIEQLIVDRWDKIYDEITKSEKKQEVLNFINNSKLK
eukprot:TRINITY_DN148_c0_g1_i3.p1 TRINITY_DN148_c0_g1~~TRINITY_DN148_c0_g1_i3.p1  ORF type:complete len:420 (-),score=35.95 TRINITY_DN148_c0_g1_i3:1960-3219(-)